MGTFSRKRKEHYEDKNWPKYEEIMNKRGQNLVVIIDVDKGFTTLNNLELGDGIWEKDGNHSFRDLKICGKKYHCPVSKNSIEKFDDNGWYDFYDPYFAKDVFSVPKKEIVKLYNNGDYSDSKDGLVRFHYEVIKNLALKYRTE